LLFTTTACDLLSLSTQLNSQFNEKNISHTTHMIMIIFALKIRTTVNTVIGHDAGDDNSPLFLHDAGHSPFHHQHPPIYNIK